MRANLIAFTIAFLSTLILTVPVRRLALRIGLVDKPNARKVHSTPIPLLGGLAMYIGVVLPVLLMNPCPRGQLIAILAGATLLALVGFLDDGGLLHHQIKLMIAMPMAAVFLVGSGIRVRLLSSLIPEPLGIVLDIGLTIFWTTGITAAFSILDHMDGLCAGIAGIAALFFAVAASLTGQRMVVTLALATFGAAMGFLRWNFNPAKIFMGDGGAMFLGYLMAALSLKIRPEDSPDLAKWLVPLLILGVPIFDTSLVSVSRARRGLVPFTSPGKDHTAHRLSNLGLGHRGAVLILYGFATVFGIAGIITIRLAPAAAFTLAGVLILCAAIAIFLLEGAPFDRQAKLQQSSSAS